MILTINTQDTKQVIVGIKGDSVDDQLVDSNQYGSQILLPMIESLLKKHGLLWTDLSGVEVTTGPGSFVGLRVGATVAQTLGYVLAIPVNGQKNKPINLIY